jgi:hypothetical protein
MRKVWNKRKISVCKYINYKHKTMWLFSSRNVNWRFFSCVVVVCTVPMWASHLPPHVHGHSMSLLKLHLWCVWGSGMFLIYCHTTKTSGVKPVDNGDMASNHLTQANGLGSIHLKTDRHCNPNGVIHHRAATHGTAHCSNTMCHTTGPILVLSIWCSVFGWRGSLSISMVMPVHWTVHKWYIFPGKHTNLRQVFTVCSTDEVSSWNYGPQA